MLQLVHWYVLRMVLAQRLKILLIYLELCSIYFDIWITAKYWRVFWWVDASADRVRDRVLLWKDWSEDCIHDGKCAFWRCYWCIHWCAFCIYWWVVLLKAQLEDWLGYGGASEDEGMRSEAEEESSLHISNVLRPVA